MFGGKISRVWILVIFLTIILGLYSVQTVNVEAIETIDDKSAVKDKKKFNFALNTAGAVVLDKAPASAKGYSNLLNNDEDEYAIAHCSEEKWVVIGLSEDIVVSEVVISQYEKYSSKLKDFNLSTATVFPSDQWKDLGTYQAKPLLGEQIFPVKLSSAHSRYLKVHFLTNYDNDQMCTISQIKVHGTTVIASLTQELELSNSLTKDIRTQLSISDIFNNDDSGTDPAASIDEAAESIQEGQNDTDRAVDQSGIDLESDNIPSEESQINAGIADGVDSRSETSDNPVEASDSLKDDSLKDDSSSQLLNEEISAGSTDSSDNLSKKEDNTLKTPENIDSNHAIDEPSNIKLSNDKTESVDGRSPSIEGDDHEDTLSQSNRNSRIPAIVENLVTTFVSKFESVLSNKDDIVPNNDINSSATVSSLEADIVPPHDDGSDDVSILTHIDEAIVNISLDISITHDIDSHEVHDTNQDIKDSTDDCSFQDKCSKIDTINSSSGSIETVELNAVGDTTDLPQVSNLTNDGVAASQSGDNVKDGNTSLSNVTAPSDITIDSSDSAVSMDADTTMKSHLDSPEEASYQNSSSSGEAVESDVHNNTSTFDNGTSSSFEGNYSVAIEGTADTTDKNISDIEVIDQQLANDPSLVKNADTSSAIIEVDKANNDADDANDLHEAKGNVQNNQSIDTVPSSIPSTELSSSNDSVKSISIPNLNLTSDSGVSLSELSSNSPANVTAAPTNSPPVGGIHVSPPPSLVKGSKSSKPMKVGDIHGFNISHCKDLLKYEDFHAKILAKLQNSDPESNAGSQDNVIKQLLLRIRSMELNYVISEMYISQLSDCYRGLIAEIAKLETLTDQTIASKVIEAEIMNNNITTVSIGGNLVDIHRSGDLNSKLEDRSESINISVNGTIKLSLSDLFVGEDKISLDDMVVILFLSWVTALLSLLVSAIVFCCVLRGRGRKTEKPS